MRIAPMAGVAGYFQVPHREDTGARKICIDLPHQHNHLARDVLARIDVRLQRSSTTVAVAAVHVERVAEFAHERICAVYMRVRRQQLETDSGPLLRGWLAQ